MTPALKGNGPECWDEFGKWVNPGPVECADVYPPGWPLVSAPTTTVPQVVVTIPPATIPTTAAPTTTQPTVVVTLPEPTSTTLPTAVVELSPGPTMPTPDTTAAPSTTTTVVLGTGIVVEQMPPFLRPAHSPVPIVQVSVSIPQPARLPETGVGIDLALLGAVLVAAGGALVRGARR